MPCAILVDHLSKSYYLGELQQTMLREALTGVFRRLGGEKPPERKLIYALKDVSLEIKQGEVVGLVGRNGAGKSTLLKLLSKITYPTSGAVSVKGRVASLLEVGTGFHEELTGRENIYLNGSILGMSKKEIDASMEQIVAFADIGPFLDTPIKRYSTGMRVRLGFSVAAHLVPDVLFVDEVLAVGDVSFQKKCLGTIKELGDSGRTVLFVSHNMAAVENLCRRVIWIESGQVRMDGQPNEVIRAYLNSFESAKDKGRDLGAIRERKGTGAARFTKMEILSLNREEKSVIHSGDSFSIRLHYNLAREIPNVHFGLRISSDLGLMITESSTWSTGVEIPLGKKGPGYIDLAIDFLNLMPGRYYIGLWISSLWEKHDFLENCVTLDIEPSNYYGSGRGIEAQYGLIFLPCRWRVADGDELGATLNASGARNASVDTCEAVPRG